ncbi:E3 ubiquitin-protein ligase MIB2-like isoform X2 [Haliotis asinina]|uniref:E3 ubiquitin-protein ligase MIB2-like isoform X2 n=1 Tax=Haliotis asinina TaxID=109174 RepID=UPI003532195F
MFVEKFIFEVTVQTNTHAHTRKNAHAHTHSVRHTKICDACTENGIVGIRWKCSVCDDVDLCSVCYVTDKHDLTHPFLRIDSVGAQAVPVGKRNQCMKARAMGIFPGATVVRGKDWRFDNQDGGPGSKGHVTSLSTPTTLSARSVVEVAWATGHTNSHHLGYKGLVDLKYTEEAPGPDYYPKHLPLLDATSAAFTGAISNTDSGIKEGDKVCIELDEAALKELQKAAGSWSAGMARLIGKTGTVRGFSQTGDATVEFDSQKWRIVPSALRKVPELSLGNVVRIIDDEDKARNLQEDHGGWLDDMKKVLGRRGRIVKIDSDGDVAVKFGTRVYLFNPCCCKLDDGEVDEDEDDDDDGDSSDDDDDDVGVDEALLRLQLGGGFGNFIAGLALLEALKDAREQAAGPAVFFKAIVEGDIGAVRNLIQRDSDLVNTSHNGIPPLQVAAHENKLDIARLLVQHGAQKNSRDKDGDTALVLAISKSNEAVAEFLINAGVDVNISNAKGRSPIHIAAYSGQARIMTLLIAKNCDVNAKDMSGDTALHDAVERGSLEAVVAILSSPRVDVRIKNAKGFMPIHMAAMREHERIVEKIILKNRQVINAAKEDGWTALHLAAFNDNTDVIKVLIKYKADLRATTGLRQTPLHLACQKANFDPVRTLVDNGAEVNAQDKDGDTPLHIVMMGQTGGLMLRLLIGQLPRMDEESRVRIATYLIEHRANPDIRNHNNMTPSDVCRSDRIKEAVASFRKSRESGRPTSSRGQLLLCSKCQNVRASAIYLPCGHKDTCPRCCKSVRQCGICGRDVNRRVGEDGKKIGDDCSIQ